MLENAVAHIEEYKWLESNGLKNKLQSTSLLELKNLTVESWNSHPLDFQRGCEIYPAKF